MNQSFSKIKISKGMRLVLCVLVPILVFYVVSAAVVLVKVEQSNQRRQIEYEYHLGNMSEQKFSTLSKGEESMPLVVIIYFLYATVSVCMTMWVAGTLHKNGRLFLIDAFHGDESRADAVNHLLVVGFYLINIGFILLFLRAGVRPTGLVDGIEYISTKLGVVLIVLGGMHFFNMFNFDKMRKKGNAQPIPAIKSPLPMKPGPGAV